MEIYRLSQCKAKRNKCGVVKYYLFKDFEIHWNLMSPHTEQRFHKHNKVQEIVYIIKGEVLLKRKGEIKTEQRILGEGDIVVFNPSSGFHALCNCTDVSSEFLAFKRLPDEKDYKEIFKTDKIGDSNG